MTEAGRRRTSFAGDVLRLVGGTTLAQGISVFVSPVLTRLYLPDAFGIAALFDSITSILTEISCLRYPSAIMLPEADEEAANLLGVSVGSAILLSLLTVPIVWLGQSFIADALKAPALAPYLWLVPPAMFLAGLFGTLRAWNTRTKHFGRLSTTQVIASAVASGAKVGAGLGGLASEGSLIGANVLGLASSTAILGGQIWRDDRRLLRGSIALQGMFQVLKRYRKFPLLSIWSGLLNSVSWQLPVFMLAAFFSPAVVGFYSLGNRVARLPMTLVGISLSQVFYQRAAEARHSGSLDVVVLQVYKRLVVFSLYPMLLLTLIGQELFTVVFGAEWAEAGLYTQILGVYLFFNFVSRPLGQLFSVLERQEADLIVNVLLIVSRFGALWFGGRTGDILLTMTLFSLSGVVVYGGYSLWGLWASGVSLRDSWWVLFRSLLQSGIFLAGAWTLCALFSLPAWGILVVYAISACGYYAWVSSRDDYVMGFARRSWARIQAWRASR